MDRKKASRTWASINYVSERVCENFGSGRFIHSILEHQEAARICKALKRDAFIPVYREPNMIRLALVALYTSFQEV
ncbi:hypothetical protein ABEW06_11450 [Peribacillus simplex]